MVGAPLKTNEPGLRRWHCEWDMGAAWPLGRQVSTSESSLHALSLAMTSVTQVLLMKEKQGDRFYTDAALTDQIEDIEAYLPMLRPRQPEKKFPR